MKKFKKKNWDLLYAKLNNHYKPWSYKRKKKKKMKMVQWYRETF